MGRQLGVAPGGPGRAWLTLAISTVTSHLPRGPALYRSSAPGRRRAPHTALGLHWGPSRHRLATHPGAGL